MDEVAAAVGAGGAGDWTATGVSIDSRSLRPGDLFVAVKGPHFDGHDFIAEVLAKGAAAASSTTCRPDSRPTRRSSGSPTPWPR